MEATTVCATGYSLTEVVLSSGWTFYSCRAACSIETLYFFFVAYFVTTGVDFRDMG